MLLTNWHLARRSAIFVSVKWSRWMPRFFENVAWEFDFELPPALVWPLISDTDRMDRALGLPRIEYRHEPLSQGGSLRHGRLSKGRFEIVWREFPYEWEAPR